MPNTASVVCRDTAVLVVIDEQERLAAAMERREAVLAATARMIRVAALTGVPIVVTRQYPRGLGDNEPALEHVLAEVAAGGASVSRVDKVSFDCFSEPAFADAVGALGRRQIALAGMETHICVAQTALTALRADYDVHVACDATCSRDAMLHDAALARLAAAGGTVTSSESFAYELVQCAGTDEFKALLGIIKG